MKIVQEYLDGKFGYDLLAGKYKVKADTQIMIWINVYKKYGIEGLARDKTKKFVLFNISLMYQAL